MSHSTRTMYPRGSRQERTCHALATRLFASLPALMTDHPLVKMDSTEWPGYVVDAWCRMIQQAWKRLESRR